MQMLLYTLRENTNFSHVYKLVMDTFSQNPGIKF